MKNKIVVMILLGLYLWLSGLNTSLNAQTNEKKEKIPTGLKTKTEIEYKFVEKSGKYEQVLDMKRIYRYDDKGNQIEYAWYGADGKLMSKSLFKYDDKGNQIERAWYGADGKLKNKTLYKYKYDGKGNKIEWAWYADGNLERKFLFQYDGKGNQIEKAWYGADGKLQGKFLSKYDDKGKKIEETRYKIKEESGKVKEILEIRTVWEYEFYKE